MHARSCLIYPMFYVECRVSRSLMVILPCENVRSSLCICNSMETDQTALISKDVKDLLWCRLNLLSQNLRSPMRQHICTENDAIYGIVLEVGEEYA